MRVYIAGPITQGERTENIRNAILAADALRLAGHAPYVPHLDFLWGLLIPVSYEAWLALDFAWLAVSEALVRLPGASVGADREVAEAHRLGVPVYYGVDKFLTQKGGY